MSPTPVPTPATTCSWSRHGEPHSIVGIAHVQQQARAAASQAIDVNDACPYPFGTSAGQIFREAFNAERNALLMARSLA